MKKTQSFTQGGIFLPLIRFSMPVFAALFLQSLYGAVDLMVVGRFGGALADVYVSAVSTGSQVMQTVTVAVNGLAMGLTIFVARRIGAGEPEQAGSVIGSGIALFGAIALVLTVAMSLCAPALAAVMRAPEEAAGQTTAYIFLCSLGSVFIVAYNLVGSIFRGVGDSKLPLLTVAAACVLNIAGDLLLVAVFHLGAAGAALATVMAQFASVALSLLVIRRRELPFSFSLRDVRFHKKNILRILRLGVPIALQDVLVSISFLVIIAIVNGLGLTASAGVGVAEKLCGFLMLLPSAYMESMSAFVAQNIGAERPDRARRALGCGIATSVFSGVLMGALTFWHGDLLAGIFAQDSTVVLAAWEYLKAYAIDCLLTAFLFCFIGYFNGCGCTTFVMVQGIVGAFGVRLPLSWVFSRIQPVSLFRVGLATPASSLVQILLCGGYFAALFLASKRKKALRRLGGI